MSTALQCIVVFEVFSLPRSYEQGGTEGWASRVVAGTLRHHWDNGKCGEDKLRFTPWSRVLLKKLTNKLCS